MRPWSGTKHPQNPAVLIDQLDQIVGALQLSFDGGVDGDTGHSAFLLESQ
jgi:hypothetical protein